MEISVPLKTAFEKRAKEALTAFSNTVGQCVGLCAYISTRLTEDSISNRVALGSLSSNGLCVFKYVSSVPLTSSFWDGHAWIEFPGGIIGEPSLFRTARAAPPHSNLRRNLDALGLLGKGAILIPATAAFSDYGLKYQQVNYLENDTFMPLIGGLMAINNMMPSSK